MPRSGNRELFLVWESAHGWEPAGELLSVLRETWTRTQLERMDLLIARSGSLLVRLSFAAGWLDEVRSSLAKLAEASGFEVVEPAAASPEAGADFEATLLADAHVLEEDVSDVRPAWARAAAEARVAQAAGGARSGAPDPALTR